MSQPPAVPMPAIQRKITPALVIGGAGFIGCNLSDALLRDGGEVIIFDSLVRPGVERNLDWLQSRHGARLHVMRGDIREADAIGEAVADAGAVFHLAGQVAVTSSLDDPMHDFSVNAQGTLNVLEAVRQLTPATPVIFASTNKVYGSLGDVAVEVVDGRYLPVDPQMRRHGVSEHRPLDFCTPYGCSKGAADQYVLDYAHSFGLRSAVLRMSCIYGPRQFGTEDQGWVAHFLISALRRQAITIYGDGMQVRDVLHVNDAVAAYRLLLASIDDNAGRAFNLGGGPDNCVSLGMMLDEIATLTGADAELIRGDWRAGDQLYFVADTGRLEKSAGWRPTIGWREGLQDLADWLQQSLPLAAQQELHA
jgi:CDP-paratose 2-epimerase